MGRKKRVWKRDSERGQNQHLTDSRFWQEEATQFNRQVAERNNMEYVKPHTRSGIQVQGYFRRKPS